MEDKSELENRIERLKKDRKKYVKDAKCYEKCLKEFQKYDGSSRKYRLQQKAKALQLREYVEQFKKRNQIDEQIASTKTTLGQWKKLTSKVNFSLYYDFSRMVQNAHEYFGAFGFEDPMFLFSFTLLMGGCDFFEKIFPQVSYDRMKDELYKNLRMYRDLFTLVDTNVELDVGNGNIMEFRGKTMIPDRELYERFAETVYRDQPRRSFPNKKMDRYNRWQVQMQMGWIMFIVRYIPYLRWKTGMVIDLSPYNTGNTWGYREGNVSGVPFKVCTKNKYKS